MFLVAARAGLGAPRVCVCAFAGAAAAAADVARAVVCMLLFHTAQRVRANDLCA